MRTRLLVPLALVIVVAAACGDDAGSPGTTAATPGLSGSIHRTGGLDGRDETWVLESDGTVLGPEGATGTMAAADRAALAAAALEAGFFDLDAEYLPDDLCCDRFLYEVTLSDGTRTHTVTTLDAADAPESLFALIQVFLSGVQAAG